MLWKRVFALAAGVLCCVARVHPDDCNANGVEDTLDILPGNIELEPEYVWGHVGWVWGPEVIVGGDWNSDGKVDLATANEDSFNISIFLNIGDGVLEEPSHYYLSGAPESLLAPDLNGDGKLDLVSGTTSGLFVLLGRGDGTFEKAVSYAREASVHGVLAADFNGDGTPDLAAADREHMPVEGSTSRLLVLLGHGDGTFEDGASYEVGGRIESFLTSDLNNDGTPDLIAEAKFDLPGTESAGRVHVVLGRGDGTFEDPVTYDLLVEELSSLLASDLNGDGTPDLAALGSLPDRPADQGPFWDCVLLVMFNHGDGIFEERVRYELEGKYLRALLATDVNDDGKPDLVASSRFGLVSVLVGRGDGTFEEEVRHELGGSRLGALLATDVNDDGKSDLIATQGSERRVSVSMGRGDGTFEDAIPYNVGYEIIALLPLDLDGDGKVDLAGAGTFCWEGGCARGVFLFPGRGDGTFEDAIHYELADIYGSPLVTSDFDGDGIPDVALVTTVGNQGVEWSDFSGSLLMFLGRGDGTFEKALSSEVGGAWFNSLLVSEFNGDGKPDLAVSETHENIVVLLGRGDGTFEEGVVYEPGTTRGPFCLVASDFNGDGKADLVMNKNDRILLVALGRGDGTFEEAIPHALGTNGVSGLLAGDFDHDGKPDLAVAAPLEGAFVLLGDGDGFFEQVPQNGLASVASVGRYDRLLASDLNGDGVTDMVVGNRRSARVEVYLGRGDGTFEKPMPYEIGGNLRGALAAADIDGDEKIDLAVVDTDRADRGPAWDTDRVLVLVGHGDGTFQDQKLVHAGGGWNLSSVGRVLLASDFDGDGGADLALANPSGIWVLKNRTRPPASLDRDENGIPDECQGPRFLRGDCNDDGEVNISDATCILNWLFAGQADPGCVAATNTNGDDAADITDATYLLSHLFSGGPAPVAPFPDCGPGMLPADKELGCENPCQ